MIILPPGLVSTKYSGYFYSIPDKKLYSIKTGVLKEVKKKRLWRNNPSFFEISHKGIRRGLYDQYLNKLSYPKTVEIYPMECYNE